MIVAFPTKWLILFLPSCSGLTTAGFLPHTPTEIGWCRSVTSILSHKSVNHGTGDYHFEQQPRATSFISQFSKRDLEERRQPQIGRAASPPEWDQVPLFRQPIINQQQPAPAPTSSQNRISNDMKAFNDNVSANLKAMTSLLGDVKESLSSQSSDIRSLNRKYEELEKRLDRAEIASSLISKDLLDMKSSKTSVVSESRYGPLYMEAEHARPNDTTNYNAQGGGRHIQDSINEKLDEIKQQITQLDFAVKVGEVSLNSYMEDVNRRFDNLKSTDVDDSAMNDANQQFKQPQPPPFEPGPTYPGKGYFRYEGPRPGVSYEIPSRQVMQSQSSANQNAQRRNKSFISAISERELSERRELFEPVQPMHPFLEPPPSPEYFYNEFDDYYPDGPFYDDDGFFEEDYYDF
ncbi:hypothetical protein HJC23_000658 [Cyclotella cryptica]|uniref:Uncharacterized protein n=1 Tax=Cyclotella cryptica TaxID=29204 RepID=A0ABD3QDE7_9STRA|eukprot:CCRYP_008070-RA/>CCRYP_008070-RA protein AED:0.42 eAED:0.42 QI:0/-1/0/1/-1/1/1/0/404